MQVATNSHVNLSNSPGSLMYKCSVRALHTSFVPTPFNGNNANIPLRILPYSLPVNMKNLREFFSHMKFVNFIAKVLWLPSKYLLEAKPY